MNNKTPAIVALVLALSLFAGAGYMALDTRQLISAGGSAQGTVVAIERRTSKGGSSDYPVIEFATASGEIHRFTTSGAGDFAVGDAVDVLYDAGDPANARADVFIELWLGSLALGGFGLLCLVVGIGTLLYERAHRTSAAESKLP